MDLTYTKQQEAFRAEVRAWLSAHVPPAPLEHYDATREGFEAHRRWERTLKSGDWGMVTWPRDYGGRGVDLIHWLMFEEEYYRAGAPGRVNQNGIFLLGPTLMEFGTPAQKARFSARDGVGRRDLGAGLVRTAGGLRPRRRAGNSQARRRRLYSQRPQDLVEPCGVRRLGVRPVPRPRQRTAQGSVADLLPVECAGCHREPIRKINGHVGFAEIFLEDVRVPAFNRLGDEGQGWHICMATAGFERGLMLRSPARYQQAAAKLAALYRTHENGVDPSLKKDVVQAWMNAEAYALSIYATASRLMAGGKIGAEASTNKIFWSELDIHLHQTALAILGPHAEVLPSAPDAGDVGDWLDDYIFALAGPIYAGSNEIQRNIIAERMLGLPR